MAQKKQNNFIFYAALAGAFFIYGKVRSKLLADKLAAEKEAEEAAKEALQPTPSPTPSPKKKAAPKPNAQEKAFIDAIRKLQEALGISPATGFVGEKTKAALRALKLSDVVTAANVADLITKVQSAKQRSNKPVLSLATQVRLAWNKSNSSQLVVTETFRSTPKLEDKVRNVWNDDPRKTARTFTKGSQIKKSDGFTIPSTTTSNKIVLKNKAGEFFILDPGNFIVQ
jgi:pyruvate/2-oxoglutarate dehydrogenase complex dihydrolipoamide acyltransferase (E2) component